MGGASVAASGRQAPLLDVDVDGALITLRARYDPALIKRLKQLPGRRYVAQDTEWVLPARSEALVALARLLADLDDRATLSDRARRRLERYGPGRVEWCDGEFAIRVAPRPRRLAKIRALPERRWDPERRCWELPATRAGALALAELLDEGELVATPAAATRVRQVSAARPAADRHDEYTTQAGRASPTPHWRHVTRGPIYAANHQRREWIAGVGWCVRVRVNSQRTATARPKSA